MATSSFLISSACLFWRAQKQFQFSRSCTKTSFKVLNREVPSVPGSIPYLLTVSATPFMESCDSKPPHTPTHSSILSNHTNIHTHKYPGREPTQGERERIN